MLDYVEKRSNLRNTAEKITLDKPSETPEDDDITWKRGPEQTVTVPNNNQNYFRLQNWTEVRQENKTTPYYSIRVNFKAETVETDRLSLVAIVKLRSKNGRLRRQEIELLNFHEERDTSEVVHSEKATIKHQLNRVIREMAETAVKGIEHQSQRRKE